MSGSSERVASMSVAEFAAALASEQATPGGGAASAVGAALAASLTAMVVRLSLGRAAYTEHASLHATAIAASDSARERFLALADDDAAAYASYRAARRMPHGSPADDEARASATREAARRATEVPLALVRECHAQIDLVERLAGRSNRAVSGDLEVAALLLGSGARAGAVNITANLEAVGDEGYASAVRAEVDQRLQQIQTTAAKARERILKGTPRSPE